jgi:hypothetical protein
MTRDTLIHYVDICLDTQFQGKVELNFQGDGENVNLRIPGLSEETTEKLLNSSARQIKILQSKSRITIDKNS